MLLIVSIATSFHIAENASVALRCALPGVSVLGAVLLRRREGRSGVARWLGLYFTVLAMGSILGTVEEWLRPPVTPFPLNSAVMLQARVTEAQAVTGGTKILLAVNHIVDEDSSQEKTVAFPVEWLVWSKMSPATVGSTVQLAGVLELPPVQTASGAPIRQQLASQGIHYEFQGRLVQLQDESTNHRTSLFYGWEEPLLTWSTRDLTNLGASADDANLLMSVVFGSQTTPPSSQEQQVFLRSGLLHVLAASGANVFLMESFFQTLLWPLRWLRPRLHYPQFIIHLCSMALTWVFCALCSFQPSIVRATLMSNYRTLGTAVNRQISAWQGMLIAGLVMTVLDPSVIFTTSSILSFLATVSVQKAVTHSPRLFRNQRAKRWPLRAVVWLFHRTVSTLQITLTVEMYLTPVLVYFFQQLTPLSILGNVLAEPVLFVLLPVSAALIGTLLFHAVFPWLFPVGLSRFILSMDTVVLHMLLRLSHWIAGLPVSLYHTSSISLLDLASYYVLILGVPSLVRWVRKGNAQPFPSSANIHAGD